MKHKEVYMEDNKIVTLFFQRNEEAIQETKQKYGNYCKTIMVHILKIKEDVEECEYDVYMKLWNSIPPNNPTSLKVFVGTIARNLAIQKYRYYHADKRNQHMETTIEEIEQSVATIENVETEIAKKELVMAINRFLEEQKVESRIIFVRRYFKMQSISDICKEMKISKSKVETSLSRTRKKLKLFLGQEGYEV